MLVLRVFAIMILVLFVSEVAIMLLFTLIPPLSGLVSTLINAGLQVLVLMVLLFRFVYRPLRSYIEDRDRAVRSLAVSEERFRDIAANANEWIWEVDPRGRYTYSSPVVEQILGYTPEEVLERHFYDFFHPDDREALKQEAFKVVADKTAFCGFINRNVHKDGRSVWLATSGTPVLNPSGELLGYRGADTVKHEESAIIDALTGSLNRRGFYLLAGQQIKLAIRKDLEIGIIFADMDNLKQINDHFGHLEGDRALSRMAKILKGSVREADVVARYGGDEFVVLLIGVSIPDIEQVVLRKIEENIARYNSGGDRDYALSISVGYSIHDTRQVFSLDELISMADRAMYKRKQSGRRQPLAWLQRIEPPNQGVTTT